MSSITFPTPFFSKLNHRSVLIDSHCQYSTSTVCNRNRQYAQHGLNWKSKYKTIVVLRASRKSNSEEEDEEEEEPRKKKSTPTWKKWIVGLVMSLVLPSFGHKYGPLVVLHKKVETTIETMESLTEAVEELAEAVEKMADEVEDRLDDDSKLKDVVESIESLARETVEKAQLVGDIIDKVKKVEDELEEALHLSMEQEKPKKTKKHKQKN